MAIKHMTYLDLTPAQRKEGADQARAKLQGLLTNPWLTPEQRTQVGEQIARVGDWEQGRLPVVHTVEVVEAVPIKEE